MKKYDESIALPRPGFALFKQHAHAGVALDPVYYYFPLLLQEPLHVRKQRKLTAHTIRVSFELFE